MKSGLFLVCASAALSLAASGAQQACAAAAPARTGHSKPTKVRDWTAVVTPTPAGGFMMGNPDAKVKLVEYGSLACPHCRHFEETGYKPLVQQYVRSGAVSYEFRNLLINGPDISISLLAHCAGPAKFFPMSELVYATQPEWQKRLEDMSDADKAAIDKMTDQQRVIRFAEIGGMAQIAARFGVTPARAKQCLADPKGLQRLLDMTKTAMDNGIGHTPTFLINGKAVDATTWDALEPELKKALGEAGQGSKAN
jgi:protein-disulfide isomerase